jgi:hypothetical protein
LEDISREEIIRIGHVVRDRARYGEGFVIDVDEDSKTWGEIPKTDRTPCGAMITAGVDRGSYCMRPAGNNTSHVGVGRCRQHGGEKPDGLREGAWAMAHAFARALDCTPWEGLLQAVRIAAGRVAFIEHKLSGAEVDRQLEPPDKNGISEAARTEDQQGTNLFYWVKQAELWHDKLAKVSKLAIDAGVAERLVRQLETEARIMLQATHRTLDELGFSDDEKQRAVVIMSRNLLALEAEEVGLSVKETE